MLRHRVIPVLLLRGRGLCKTVRFKEPTYVGDPVNTLRIFSEKEVDEIAVLDIEATRERRGPNMELIRDMASECFMPMAYGGGIHNVDQVRKILFQGVEKVILNTVVHEAPQTITEIAKYAGSSAVVVSIDVRRRLLGGTEVMVAGGRVSTGKSAVDYARAAEGLGAGELLVNSVDRDGTMRGYDVELIKEIAAAVDVPVIACGGCGGLHDLNAGIAAGADAVAAGSVFVFQGRHRAVLLSYPTPSEINALSQ